MADQLSLNITTPGADAAVAALRNVQQAAQQTAAAVQQMSGAAAQAGAATQQLTSHVTAATTTAQAAHGAWLSVGGAIGQLPGPLGQAGHAFAALSTQVTQAQAGLLAIGGAMATVGEGIASGLGVAIQEATQFQRTFADVQVVSQATTAEMEALQAKSIELGASSQFNSQKIAKAFYELSSAGLTVAESLQAIEPITRMATLGSLQLGAAAEDVVKILRQFGLEASQTTHVVDVLTVGVQGSILHWTEIGEAYRNIAGRAHAMNVSLEETTGALMVASNAGLTAAMAGTAVGTFLDRLAKGSGEAGAAIAQLHLRLYDSSGAFVGLNNVVRQVAEATSGMTEAETNGALARLAGARASGFLRNALTAQATVMIDGNATVLRGADLLDYYTQQARNADGASAKAAQTIQQTFDYQLKVLSGTIQEVGIRLGTEFLPALTAITPQVTSLINAFVTATPNIHATAAALLAVASATAIAAGGFLTASAVAAAFGTTLAAAAAAAAVAAAPILAIGAAIGLLAAAWINDWGNIRETTTSAAVVITGASTQTVSDLTTIADYLTNILIPKWQQWVDLQTKPPPAPPGTQAPAPVAGLTPGVNPALNPATSQSEIALATAQGARSGEAWSQGYVASITEDAGGEKVTGLLLLDPSALNQQGSVAGGAMGTGFTQEFTDTVTNGSPRAFSTVDSLWNQTLDNMKKEMEAKQLTIQIFDAEAHRAELYAQGALSATIVAKAMGETLAAKFDPALALEMAMARIRTLVKGNLTKAIQEAAAEGNQAAAEAFLKEETMRAAITTAIKDSDAARKAEILTMEAEQGVEDTLLHLRESGSISAEAYANAINGIAASHTKAKTASEEHKAALQTLIQSTDAGAVSQGLYAQHLDDFIEKTARSLPAIEGQARALINAGDSMGALRVEAQALGLSEETLIAASQGNVKAQAEVAAALEKTTGGHKAATAAIKEHRAEIALLVASTDAAQVAQGLYAEQVEKVGKQALTGMDIATRSVVQATLNANDTFTATRQIATYYGLAVVTVQHALEGQRVAEIALTEAIKRKTQTEQEYRDRALGKQADNSFAGAVDQTIKAYRDLGLALPTGIAQGAQAGAPALNQAVSGVLAGAEATVRDQWQIRSPSQWWADRGVDAVAGLQEGFLSAMPSFQAAVATSLTSAATTTAGTFSDVLSQHVNLGGAGIGPGGPTTAPITDAQVQEYIRRAGAIVPVYGPSASDLARQQAVQNWMIGGQHGPVPGTTSVPHVSGYGQDPYIALNTEVTRYRELTAIEARRALEDRGVAELLGYQPPITADALLRYRNQQMGPGASGPPIYPALAQQMAVAPATSMPSAAQAAEDFQRSLDGATRELRQQATLQRVLAQADQAVLAQYGDHRRALEEAGAATRAWAEDVRASGASAQDQVQQFGQMADSLTGFHSTLGGLTTVIGSVVDQSRTELEQARTYLDGLVANAEGDILRQTAIPADVEGLSSALPSGPGGNVYAGGFNPYASRPSSEPARDPFNSFDTFYPRDLGVQLGLTYPGNKTRLGDYFATNPWMDPTLANQAQLAQQHVAGSNEGISAYATTNAGNLFQIQATTNMLKSIQSGDFLKQWLPPGMADLLGVLGSMGGSGGGGGSGGSGGGLGLLGGTGATALFNASGMVPGNNVLAALKTQALYAALLPLIQSGGVDNQPMTTQQLTENLAFSNAIASPGALSPAQLHAGMLGGSSGGGGYGGGVSGSGFAQAPFTFGNELEGFIGSGTRESASLLAERMSTAARNAHDFSVALAGLNAETPIVALSWSSIKDWSKQADTSMAHIAGAFSAIPLDLNSKMLSSITEAWTKPTIGGPSGPTPLGPGSSPFTPSGNTYGGQAAFQDQRLIDSLLARGVDPNNPAGDFNAQLGQLRKTDAEYIRVVGQVTDTLGDLEEAQRRAAQDVSNLSYAYAQAGDGTTALQAAQDRLVAATNAVAAMTVYHPPQIAGYTPTPMNFNTTGSPVGNQAYYTPTGQTPANTITTTPGPNGTTLSTVNQTGGSTQAMVNILGVMVPAGASSNEVLAILAAHGIYPQMPENPRVFGEGGIVTSRQLAIVGDSGPELIIPLAALQRDRGAEVSPPDPRGTTDPTAVRSNPYQFQGVSAGLLALRAANEKLGLHDFPKLPTAMSVLNQLNRDLGIANFPFMAAPGGSDSPLFARDAGAIAGPALTSITPTPPLSSVAGTRFDTAGSTLSSIGGMRSASIEQSSQSLSASGGNRAPSNALALGGGGAGSATTPYLAGPAVPYKALGGLGVDGDGTPVWNGVRLPGYGVNKDGTWLTQNGVTLTDQEAQILAKFKNVNLSPVQLSALLGVEPTPTPTPTTTTPSPSPTAPSTPRNTEGLVHIGKTGTGLDVYERPDGTMVRVPVGTRPPGWVPELQFAAGGIVTRPTRALIGEAGPEAIIPLNNPRTALQALNSINQQLGAATYSPLSVLNSINQSMGAPQYTALTALNTLNSQHGLPQYQTALTALNNLNYQHGVAQYPTRASGSSGPVNLTANITLTNTAVTPQLAAQLVRQMREEFRRQGVDTLRIGGL